MSQHGRWKVEMHLLEGSAHLSLSTRSSTLIDKYMGWPLMTLRPKNCKVPKLQQIQNNFLPISHVDEIQSYRWIRNLEFSLFLGLNVIFGLIYTPQTMKMVIFP